MLKPLLAAVGGAAVGFWVAKLRYEKAAYAYATERIEQAKVYAEERADREIQKFQAEASAEAVNVVAEVMESENAAMSSMLDDNMALVGLVQNYQGFSASQPPMTVEEDSESHIVLIRRKEFFEGPADDYHQIAVTYFQNDDILLDPSDKQLDIQQAIGNIRPNWFGNEADDENVCYVRNTKIKIEFEVNRSLGSYAKDVLGLSDDEDKAE